LPSRPRGDRCLQLRAARPDCLNWLATETVPSSEPRTAARSHPIRPLRCNSRCSTSPFPIDRPATTIRARSRGPRLREPSPHPSDTVSVKEGVLASAASTKRRSAVYSVALGVTHDRQRVGEITRHVFVEIWTPAGHAGVSHPVYSVNSHLAAGNGPSRGGGVVASAWCAPSLSPRCTSL
jgi:hypothetical protein